LTTTFLRFVFVRSHFGGLFDSFAILFLLDFFLPELELAENPTRLFRGSFLLMVAPLFFLLIERVVPHLLAAECLMLLRSRAGPCWVLFRFFPGASTG